MHAAPLALLMNRTKFDSLPKQGSRAPWRLKQNYLLDLRLIRHGKVDDRALQFSKHQAERAAVTAASA